MNTVTVSSLDSEAVQRTLGELERRIEKLEKKVAAVPDVRQVDDRIAEQMKFARAAEDPGRAPSLSDISMPIPNAQSVVRAAKASWALLEMFFELKMLFWTLLDRRYHMAWLTRFMTIGLVVMILTSHWWAPFAVYDNFLSHLWDKAIDLALGLILFLVLSFETRRYREWRSKR